MSGRVDFKEAGAELKFVSRPDLGFVAESRSRYKSENAAAFSDSLELTIVNKCRPNVRSSGF
jgi:hypothetical protein